MNVTPLTTISEIRKEIDRLEERLTVIGLFDDEREAIHMELDYLYSFVKEGEL